MAEQRHDGYVLPSSASESERLERQARLYGGLDFLRPSLARGPARILEVGCGTGCFARAVARLLPDAEVVGLDRDEERLALARRLGAESGLPRVRFEAGDLTALPFDAGVFDLVYARFVLVHMPDPVDAVSEMARVTCPGGEVLALDMVHSGVWFSPPKPSFATLLGRIIEVMRRRGLEPDQGLHLLRGMQRAGLEDVQAAVHSHHLRHPSAEFELYRANWLETVEGINTILATDLEERAVAAALAELRAVDPHESLLEITVACRGRVPG